MAKVDPKFKPLIEEAKHGEGGRLYADNEKRTTYSLTYRPPGFDGALVEQAVKAGLFRFSPEGGRFGAVYLETAGRKAEFEEPKAKGKKDEAEQPKLDAGDDDKNGEGAPPESASAQA